MAPLCLAAQRDVRCRDIARDIDTDSDFSSRRCSNDIDKSIVLFDIGLGAVGSAGGSETGGGEGDGRGGTL